MARTRQTAKRSTGGKAPSRKLAELAARKSTALLTDRNRFLTNISSPDVTEVWMVEANSVDKRCFYIRIGHKRHVVTEKECLELLGPHIVDYCKSCYRDGLILGGRSPTSKLDLDTAYRLGLTESVNDRSNYDKVSKSWNIDAVWLSDGKEIGEIGGCYYASDTATGYPYLIHLYSMSIEGHRNSERHETCIEGDEGIFWLGYEGRVEAYREIDCWCKTYPGRKLNLNPPEQRLPTKRTVPFQVRNVGQVQFTDRTKHCLRAGMANALDIVISRTCANAFVERMLTELKEAQAQRTPPRRLCGLRDLQKLTKEAIKCVSLQYLKDENCDILTDISPTMICARTKGVFLLTLEGTGDVNHCVCVDCNRKLILDCMEKFPLRLCVESLLACVGGNSTLIEIGEVREVVKLCEPGKRRLRQKRDRVKKRRRNAAIDKNTSK